MSEGGPRLSDPVEPMLSSEDESEADSSASVQIDSKPSSSSKAASSSYVPLSREDIRRAHREAALAATLHMEMQKAEAAHAGMSMDDYMKATGQWPSMHGMPSREDKKRLRAMLMQN